MPPIKDKYQFWLIIGTVMLFVCAQSFYTFFPSINSAKAYYWLRSLSYLSLSEILYMTVYMRRAKLAALFLVTLSLGDFVNEIFFRPQDLEYGEYIAFGLAVLVLIYRYIKIGKRSKNGN